MISQTVVHAIVTVAFLALSGVLIVMSSDPNMHILATAIITGILGWWVPSPVQIARSMEKPSS